MLNLPPEQMREALRSCLNVDRWVEHVSAAAPFASWHDLENAARSAAPLTAEELGEALGDHPRIGERRTGSGAATAFSRAEQATLGEGDEAIDSAIAAGNAEYEERFGRVFLIRAKGRSRSEILGELRRRLTLDDETERGLVGSELVDIAVLRLETIYAEHSS